MIRSLVHRRWAPLCGLIGAALVAGTAAGIFLLLRPPASSPNGFVCQGVISAPTSLTTSYRSELGSLVPVPSGWAVNSEQGDPYPTTVIGPPCFIPHGARFLIEHLRDVTMADAVSLRCSAMLTPLGVTPTPLPEASRPPVEGPEAIDAHERSYEFVCPGGFIGPAWTVLIPSTSGDGVWQLTYLGASGLGTGPWTASFNHILAVFSAP